MYGNLALNKAFEHADNILATAAKSIAEIITYEGYVNVDFMDVRTVMADSGVALMGTASAEGENRAITAAKQALLSPLLADNDIKGAKNILLNITSGKKEILMDEIAEITDYVRDEAGEDADLIFGCAHDETLGDFISVTIIATAFETNKNKNKVKKEDPPFIIETTHPISVDFKTEIPKPIEPPVKETLEIKLPFEDISDELESTDEEEDELSFKPKVDVLGISRHGETIKKPEIDLAYLENTPAYIRKKRKLETLVHSANTEVSRFTLKTEDGKKPEIRPNNRFLHDNVD